MADQSGNGDGGEVVDRPGDTGGPMEIKIRDEQPIGVAADQGAVGVGGGDGDQKQQQVAGGEKKYRVRERDSRATVLTEAVGPRVVSAG
ncbi:hypothetical protein RHMOL_Rhmol08G0154700 [Rhododendron molle]|uniref:Uncharacterized protein n=1 Tax=Rhododendron molle TaxID=49168 RepID=A0ACC0MQ97_RHOML|nr:hypothetical protein RHMOL_Rhmol08G0154700 [Rhododendron molle]